MANDKTELFAKLEDLGEQKVRENLAKGLYAGRQKLDLINEWLRQESEGKNETRFTRTEEREEEALSIARDALSVAKDANDIASSARDAARDANIIADSALREARESNKTARNAKNAAWAAAIAAIISSICAFIAIFLK